MLTILDLFDFLDFLDFLDLSLDLSLDLFLKEGRSGRRQVDQGGNISLTNKTV